MMYNLPRFLLIFFIHGAKTMIHEIRGALRGPWAHLNGGVLSARFFQWPCRLYRPQFKENRRGLPIGSKFSKGPIWAPGAPNKKSYCDILFGKLSSFQWCIICPDSCWFFSSMGQKPWFMKFEGPSGALGLICRWGSFSQIFPMAM